MLAQVRFLILSFLAMLLCNMGLRGQDYIVSTVAGGVPAPPGLAASSAWVAPIAAAVDGGANPYFISGNTVFKIHNGTLFRIVGLSSAPGYYGDGKSGYQRCAKRSGGSVY